MTGFDLAVIGVVLLSTLLAAWRGLIRVAVSLATWIMALLVSLQLTSELAPMLPVFKTQPAARYFVAFALIFVGVLIVGSLFGLILSKAVRAVGLGVVDRALGAVFGLARGLLIVLLLVLLAGLTSLPRSDWWQNAVLGKPLAVAALGVRRWLPKPLADRLSYGPHEPRAPQIQTPARVI